MKTLLISIVGLFIGIFISNKLGNGTEAKTLKIILIILLILFALWNEGVFG